MEWLFGCYYKTSNGDKKGTAFDIIYDNNNCPKYTYGYLACSLCLCFTFIKFRESGGIEHLVKLLSSNNDEVRRSASWAISICAVDEVTAAEISRHGYVIPYCIYVLDNLV